MKGVASLLVATLLVCALGSVSAGDIKQVSCSKDLDYFRETNDWLLVVYYASWCSKSTDFVSNGLKEIAPKFDFPTLTVDAYRYQIQDVRAYPTIRLYNKNNFWDYNGSRCTECVVNFINDRRNGVVPRFKAVRDRCVFAQHPKKLSLVSHRAFGEC